MAVALQTTVRLFRCGVYVPFAAVLLGLRLYLAGCGNVLNQCSLYHLQPPYLFALIC